MFVVFGVTGNTGRVVAEELLNAGEAVRVVVRSAEKGASWADRGAEVAVATLEDADAVRAALTGARAAYLLVPPVWGAEDPVAAGIAIGQTLASAAAATGTPAVLLSSTGAQVPDGTGPIRILHHTEAAFRAAQVPATFLRAAYFVENHGSVLEPVKAQGVLPSFLAAETAFPMVSTLDIGRTAARLLREGPMEGPRIVELAGPEDASPNTVAKRLSEIIGKPVTVSEAPLEAAEGALTAAGLPPAWAALYAELYRGVSTGRITFAGAPVRGQDDLGETLSRMLG